jgi:signal transduction histidine kinase
MLSSEISSILHLLSISTESEYVFAFSSNNSELVLPEAKLDTDIAHQMANIDIEKLLSDVQEDLSGTQQSKSDGQSALLLAVGDESLGPKMCLYLSTITTTTQADENDADSPSSSTIIGVGIYAPPEMLWSDQQKQAVTSALRLLKHEAQHNYETERDIIIKDLQRSNRDLDNFAYVASHDLKAPLNVIKRLVSWVMEDCASIMPADSLENLELVLSRANRMEQLLHDLLAYSRIGKEYQEATELNVKSKVVELLSLIDLPMGFTVKCDDTLVKVPEVPFGVVLLNLLANAIKHHDSGNAIIEVKVRRNQSANVITVIDNGPGVSPDNRAKIFDLFETLKPRDEIEGSGMGLSIVKRLVEHYGGHIKVDENRPRGTKFIVYWPFNNVARQVLTKLSK